MMLPMKQWAVQTVPTMKRNAKIVPMMNSAAKTLAMMNSAAKTVPMMNSAAKTVPTAGLADSTTMMMHTTHALADARHPPHHVPMTAMETALADATPAKPAFLPVSVYPSRLGLESSSRFSCAGLRAIFVSMSPRSADANHHRYAQATGLRFSKASLFCFA